MGCLKSDLQQHRSSSSSVVAQRHDRFHTLQNVMLGEYAGGGQEKEGIGCLKNDLQVAKRRSGSGRQCCGAV